MGLSPLGTTSALRPNLNLLGLGLGFRVQNFLLKPNERAMAKGDKGGMGIHTSETFRLYAYQVSYSNSVLLQPANP